MGRQADCDFVAFIGADQTADRLTVSLLFA